MELERTFLLIAAGLVVLVGALCAVGGLLLLRGRPPGWTDVVATDELLRRVAIGLLLTGVLLVASGIAVALGAPGARIAAGVATVLFVLGGFWGNWAVYGDLRFVHTGTNVAVAAIILWLLWQA